MGLFWSSSDQKSLPIERYEAINIHQPEIISGPVIHQDIILGLSRSDSSEELFSCSADKVFCLLCFIQTSLSNFLQTLVRYNFSSRTVLDTWKHDHSVNKVHSRSICDEPFYIFESCESISS